MADLKQSVLIIVLLIIAFIITCITSYILSEAKSSSFLITLISYFIQLVVFTILKVITNPIFHQSNSIDSESTPGNGFIILVYIVASTVVFVIATLVGVLIAYLMHRKGKYQYNTK
jgi:hypothetical protein